MGVKIEGKGYIGVGVLASGRWKLLKGLLQMQVIGMFRGGCCVVLQYCIL